ncbi:hypothetical protein PR202_ga16764 [Eleusine coracana subsp. coracana]|uniref:Protein kinase domain-containing protein n=1 Tax=Eleusine coracana subsp. coracana TaxID=191504 RepID=A0AAV5CNK6_ELECO|nr:hypothetical protein PR202_ga16764 [Eleusine coracana subsp. coracana]
MAMSIGEWTRGPAIGRGSSATVSLAVDHRTGAVFAVKSVAGAARAEELRREHSILQELDSPHVVRCLGLVGCDLFLEHAAGGSLADEIKRLDAGVEEGLIRYRARDVLLGLAHAHAVGVAHCDVKARNVLLAADGRAVLADFGCARRIGINDGKVMGGTPMFMAPEAARGEEQGPAADVWALGCTVVEMATGGGAPWWPRFSDPMAAMRHVAVSGEAPQCPRWMSEDAKDFLGRCFRRDPRERWTAEQLLRHPFVAAAAGDSNNSVPIVAGKEEPFVSPKSVLDQALWDDSTACVTAGASTTTATAPIDRVRELAAGAPVVPDWTWDATWITVHSEDDDVRSTLPEAELEQETSGRYAVAGSTSVAASASGNMTAVAEAVNSTAGDSYGDDAISSRSDSSARGSLFFSASSTSSTASSSSSVVHRHELQQRHQPLFLERDGRSQRQGGSMTWYGCGHRAGARAWAGRDSETGLSIHPSRRRQCKTERAAWKAPRSVLFVSLRTVAAIDAREFAELARGLAGSNRPFLWVVRPSLVRDTSGELLHLPVNVVEEEETHGGRGRVVPWAPQDEVLAHPAVGAFLTQNGWNSTVEAVSEGVPMICCPYFGDQLGTARYVCGG